MEVKAEITVMACVIETTTVLVIAAAVPLMIVLV